MRNSRIDYILIPRTIAKLIQSSSILACPAPDHKALTVTLCFNTNKRGAGYWKLNNSLLQDEGYKTLIRSDIIYTINTYSSLIPKQELFELIKVVVKESSIHYSTCKKARRMSRISQIENELDLIDKEIANSNGPRLLTKRLSLKNELNSLYKEDSNTAYIRSRSKWVEQGERSTSYFLNLEKHHQSLNCIGVLKTEMGTKVTTDKEILDEITKFYSKLYSSINTDTRKVEKYFRDLPSHKKLTHTDSESIEGLIMKDECEKALSMMKGNKSPGLDWISVEFYKMFWPELGDLIVESFNEAYQSKLLSASRNVSILSLIFKKGDSLNIKNYRPISLTNTDYKLLAHILANHLHKVPYKIISSDQTSYIRKRYIGTNIRKILDTVEYLERTNNSGILLILDFEKAFDTLEWSFLF